MSQPGVEYRPPTDTDMVELELGLRDQDVAELKALGFTDMGHVIRHCVQLSDWSLAAHVNGRLACIFGVGQGGSPWMLGTQVVARNPRILAREAPRYIRKMLDDNPRLINRVHAANTVAVRWLKRVGFTLHPATPEENGEMFHTFEMSR